MEWKTANKKRPKIGDRRTKNRFLFIPLTIDEETKWLQFAKYEEKYQSDISVFGWIGKFKPIKWINDN